MVTALKWRTGKGGIRQEEGSRLIRLEAEHCTSALPPEKAEYNWHSFTGH